MILLGSVVLAVRVGRTRIVCVAVFGDVFTLAGIMNILSPASQLGILAIALFVTAVLGALTLVHAESDRRFGEADLRHPVPHVPGAC